MKLFTELYRQLYDAVYSEGGKKFKETHLSNFVAMRGKRYNEKIGKNDVVRLMVVGRAVNGWGELMPITSSDAYAEEATKLFEQDNRFETEWGMQNGEIDPYSEYEDLDENNIPKLDKDGKKIIKKYYLSRSAFWSAALGVYEELSKEEKHEHTDWYEDIVWNNIYKVAPQKEGNPSTNLIYAQAEVCVNLLREEMKLLEPTHVLLVIDKSWVSWTSRKKVMFDFMNAFDGCKCHFYDLLSEQNRKIAQCVFTADNCKVLITCRPEMVSRDEYKNEVVRAFNNLVI